MGQCSRVNSLVVPDLGQRESTTAIPPVRTTYLSQTTVLILKVSSGLWTPDLKQRCETASVGVSNQSPVFGGSFQDEQTGAQFGTMLQSFDQTRMLKVMLGNGRHPDGYSPTHVFRWYEF